MKKVYLSLLMLCIMSISGFAQVLISPTGDGGFETGTDFPTNNWIYVAGAANNWAVGTGSVYAGIRGAYIGNATTFVGTNAASVSHFYRDVTIPVGATNVQLSFLYKQPVVDNGWDYFYVFTTTPANTPAGGTIPSTGYTQRYINTATVYSAYTTIGPIDLTALAGTTVRLVFTYKNDGVTPAGIPAVDNISLTYTPGVACSGTPTPGTVVSSQSTGCSTYSSSLSLSGSSTSTGIAYQWQTSLDGTTGWANVTGATNASYTATVTSSIYYRAQLTCTGFGSTVSTPGVQLSLTGPTVATLPFFENFEASWINACATADAPNNFWRGTPSTGTSAWRREDDITTAGWSFNTSYLYSPSASVGAHSARFHSGGITPAGTTATMDVYLNLSAAGTKQISYDFININGTDGMNVKLSTDGGVTFPTTLDAVTLATSWTNRVVTTTATSANAVLRFSAYSDYGSTDIGLDNVNVFLLAPCVAPSVPTALSLTPSLYNVGGTFTASSPAADNYIAIITTTNAAPAAPVNGISYAVGSTALGGTVVSNGNTTSFTATGLTPGTHYWLWVYSYNSLCIGGPTYSTTPLNGNIFTNVCNLTGTKTIGASGNYATLTAAMAAIMNNGLAGPVVLQLQADYNSAGETYPILINTIPCASAANTLTIRPAAGVAATITNTASSAAVFKLLNASYVTIDGVNSGGASLAISNTNTGTAANIWLSSTPTTGPGCNTVTLTNLNIIGGSNTTSSDWGIIACGDGTTPGNNSTGLDNDNINITNNTFTKCGYAVLTSGSAAVSAGANDNWVVTGNIAGPATYNTATNIGVNGMFFRNMVNLQISGNTIQNLGISTSTAFGLGGLYLEQNVNRAIITSNTIANLGTSSTATSMGIYMGTNTINSIASKNTITGLHNDNATTGSTMRGIEVLTGSNTSNDTIVNNMVSDIYSYTSTTLSSCPIGIDIEGATGGVNVWYNSVNLFGSHAGKTGITSTFALYVISTGTNMDIRNNVFVNTYDNSTTTTDKNYAFYSTATASQYSNLDFNDYYASGASNILGRLGTTDYATLATFRAAIGSNASSVSANPSFTSPTNLHIPAGTTSQLESGGTPVSITTDYDGQARPGPAGSVNGGASSTDIGADEFDGIIQDLVAPAITYTMFVNSCTTSDRTISALISDASGVNTTAFAPRLYYKKSTSPTWSSRAGTLVSGGTAFNGTWNFNLVAADMGGLAIGDVVQYFIVAQDAVGTPNVGANPSAGFTAANVNSIATYPTTPNTFTVLPTIGGVINVGVGQPYTTITAAVNAYNNSCLSGAVTFQLMDAAYTGETLPITINNNSFASATNTLTIRPNAGVAVTINGLAASTAIFKLLNAQYVTIDGVNAGGSSLTLNGANTGTFADIWLASTATTGPGCNFVTLKNMNIIGGSNATATDWAIIAGVDGASPGTGSGFNIDNVTIQNNTITKSGYGIYANGSAAISAGGLDNWIISNNIIGPSAYTTATNIGYNGMFLQNMLNLTVADNTLHYIGLTTSSTQTNGINLVSNINGATINHNTITNVTANASVSGTGSVAGFIVGTNVINATVTRNTISGVSNISTGGWGARAVIINTGTNTSNLVMANNAISDVSSYSDASSGFAPMGIDIDGSTGGVKLYYNTVNLFGTHPGLTTATMSMSLFIATTGTNLDIRNNIFVNTYDNTSSSIDKGWAIYSTATSAAFSNIDYNDYYTAAPDVLGLISSDRTNLAGIQAGFGGNSHSINMLPSFVSATDLHLLVAGANVPLIAGTPVSVTNDIDGTTRDITTPVIGTHEVIIPHCTSVAPGLAVANNPNLCVSGSTTINLIGSTAGFGIVYQWQSSPDSVTFTNITGATNVSYTIAPAITSTTFYRSIISCTLGSGAKDSTTTRVRVNPLPTITVSPDGGAYCSGSSLTMGASGGVSYVWSPAAGLSATTGAVVTTTATSTTLYTVTGTDIYGCSNTHVSTVTVTTTPPLPTVTVATPAFCSGGSTMITASGSLPGTILNENFNSGLGVFTVDNTGSTNTTALPWAPHTSPYVYSIYTFSSPDGSQFLVANEDAAGSASPSNHTMLVSPSFSLAGYSSATLSFQHFYHYISNDVSASVEISTNGGGTWTTLQNYFSSGADVGTYTSFAVATFNLAPYLGSANCKIRFNYQGAWGWFWALDNVSIAGVGTYNNITWTPGVGLYNDAALTSPYTGAVTTTVYAAPTAPVTTSSNTYTAVVTNGSCTSSRSVTVTVNPLPAVITGANTVCAGSSTTLADATTGGTWSSSNSNATVFGSTGVITGVTAGTANITYTLGTSCNRVYTITVNPLPAAIAGNADVCIGATNTLSDATLGGIWTSSTPANVTISSTGGLMGISAGTSTITYALSTGCQATTIATVNVLPVVSVTPSTNAIVCFGSSATFTASAPVTGVNLLTQDFNSGLGTWAVTNGLGTTASFWKVVTPATSTTGATGDGSAMLQADGQTVGVDQTIVTSPSFSTLGYASANLTFNQYLLSTVPDTKVAVEYSVNNGAWITLADYTDNATDYVSPTWSAASPNVTLAIPAAAINQANVRLRWNYDASSSLFWIIDNVNVNAIPPAATYTWSGNAGLSCTACASTTITPTAVGNNVYSVTATTSHACTSTVPVTVSVNAVPGTITGTAIVCQNLTTTLSNTAAGGTWTSSNTNATVNAATGVVTGNAAGTATITYTLNGGCFTTQDVTINVTPAAITGTTVVCAGSTTALGESVTGGTWSSNTISVATVNATGVVTGVAQGTADINYTLSTGCKATVTVTVNPTPTAITGTRTVCEGATTTLGNELTGGTWASSNANATIDAATGVVTGVTAGTSTISYTMATGCNTSAIVTVNTTPAAITGADQVCEGSATTLSDATSVGIWTSSAPANASVNGIGVVSGNAAGLATISYTLLTGCYATRDVTVNTTPAAITGNFTICEGQTTTLGNTLSGGTYTSTMTGVATVDPATGVVTGVASGTTGISYTMSTGCYAVAYVTVNPSPAAVNTGTAAICEGQTTTLGNTVTGGAWTSSDTTIATVNGATGVVTGVLAGNATITYTLPAGCTAATQVTVNPQPSAITGTFVVCRGQVTTLGNTVAGGTWTSNDTAVATVDAATGDVTGIAGGIASISYTLAAGCTTGATVTVNFVSEVYSVTGTGSYCNGGTGVTVGLTGSDNGSVYQLYNGTTAAGTPVAGTGSAISFGLQTAAGTYTVLANPSNGCSTNMADSAVITINPLPVVYNVTGGGDYCSGTGGKHVGLFGSENDTAISYALYTGGSVVATLTGTGAALDFGSFTVAGTYTVQATNTATSCTLPMSMSATITITPSVVPVVTVSQSGGAVVCAGSSVTFTAAPVNGGTAPVYNWSVNGTTISGTTNNTYTYMPLNGDVLTTVLHSNEYCAIPDSAVNTRTINVAPMVTPAISIDVAPGTSVCKGTFVTFTSSAINLGTAPVYTWVVNGIDVSNSTSYTYMPHDNDIIYAVLNSNANCLNDTEVYSNNVTMNVDAGLIPVASIRVLNGTYIRPGQVDSFVVDVTNGGTNPGFKWFVNGVLQPSATTAYFSSTAIQNNDSITVQVTNNGPCGYSTFNSVIMKVRTTGIAVVAPSQSDLRLVPNPNSGEFVVNGTLGTTADEAVSFEVTDMLGQVVYRGNAIAHAGSVNEKIQLGNTLANGMYMLNVKTATDSKVFHFVLKQ